MLLEGFFYPEEDILNDLQVFGFEGRNVRVVEKDGNPWWVLADVCEILELSNPSMVASRLDDDEKNTLSLAEGITTDGTGNPNATVINESGLYTVILRSDKPDAKRFRKWITSEVLPSIRKTGSYGGSPIIPNLSLSGVKMRELRLLYQVGAISRAAVESFLFAPETKTPNSGIKVQKNVQTPALSVIPPLDTFLSLPDFAGWREKLENMDGCFERFGVRLIQNRAGAYELAIDHNHKALLKLAGKDYKAKLRTDPAYIETRQVHISRCQVSAMMFDWEKVRRR